MSWLFPRLNAASGGTGLAYTGPLRFVVHTTETLSDPRAWVPGWRTPSHVVADPRRRIVVQCVSLAEAAKSLYNAVGGVQTNTEGALQVEINWMSSDGTVYRPDLPDEDYRWLAREVFAPMARWAVEYGSPIDHGNIAPTGVIPNSARDDAPQRMAFAVWEAFNGWCGHRNVPENDHWDAGLLDLTKLARYTVEALGLPSFGLPSSPTLPSSTTEEDLVLQAYKLPNSATVYVRNPVTGRTYTMDQIAPAGADLMGTLNEMVAAGMCKPLVTLGWNANWAVAVIDGRA